jgi:hypothetical protein
MPKCSVGDLAVVINAHNPTNLGRLVRVIRLQENDDSIRLRAEEGVIWFVRLVGGGRMTWSQKQGDRTKIWKRRSGPAPDSFLQPLKGRIGDQETARSKVVFALVR